MKPFACILLAAFALPSAASAQTPFDPEPVAYALCITNEMKRLALQNPPLGKDAIVAQSFGACVEDETTFRKSLAEKGMAPGAAEERLAKVRKFIQVTASDDIDRFRINRVPR